MGNKIKEILFFRKNLQLTRPYTISFKTVDKVENFIIKIKLENGIVGWGACNPSKQVIGYDLTDVENDLNQKTWEPLIGKNIHTLFSHLDFIHHQLSFNPATRTAFDLALHDAFTQALGIPLVDFWGQQIESLPTSITIGIKNVQETLKEADEYYSRGFDHLKIKLGHSLDEDIERLVKLREKFGAKIVLRIDANQGYSLEQTHTFFEKTNSLQLELVEQPTPAKQWQEWRTLPQEYSQKIVADESLLNEDDAMKLILPTPACGIFNIKLMKCGGLLPAFKIASMAHSSQLQLMWGCNDESIISITAALHIALSFKNTCYLDLDGSLDLAEDIVTGGFEIKNGKMKILKSKGLGLREV